MNKLIYILVVVALLVGGFFLINSYIYNEKQGDGFQKGYKDSIYKIDGQSVTLVNGKAESEIPGSSSKTVTQYFGNEAEGDLNGDGVSDIAFLVTQTSGGSGTFYYVVAGVKTDEGYTGTEAVLLGDRIAPQTTEIKDGKVIVNYADRAPGEPMTAQPSVGKSIWLKLDTASMQFGEVVQNFEGEADPSRMTLTMKTWAWTSAPKPTDAFSVTFGSDGKFSATTDCNSVGGSYTADKEKISFTSIVSTKKYCAGSSEAAFVTLLSTASLYHFTSKGELVIETKTGTATFK